MIDDNPFAAARLQPGEIEYLFPPDAAANNFAALVEVLKERRWRGAILGPHGSGKSTLLAMICRYAEAELASLAFGNGDGPMPVDRVVKLFVLRAGQSQLPAGAATLPKGSLLLVDGFEQLGWLARKWLVWQTARRGLGLIVTSHARAPLPTIYRTQTNLPLARKVVASLGGRAKIPPEVIADKFAQTGGDMRETLFALYDYVEAGHRASTSVSSKNCDS